MGAIFVSTVLTYQILFTNTAPLKSTEVSNQAFLFKAIGHDGKSYQLSDYKGKWVVLEWFNNECPFVEKHYGSNNMQALQKKYMEQGVAWFVVASSQKGTQGHLDAKSAQAIMKDRKANPTAVLLDEAGEMARGYRATATPHMFVIDPNGHIFYQGAIDDQPSFQKSTLEGARNFVVESLDMGLAGKKEPKTRSFPAYGCSIKNDLETKPVS